MDLEEYDNEDRDDQKWMRPLFSTLLVQPGEKFFHSAPCRTAMPFRKQCQALAFFVEGFHVVGEVFAGAAMPLILGRMCKKVVVELTDMTLGERDSFVSSEDGFHHSCIAGNLLFVARRKRPQANVCQQLSLDESQLLLQPPGRPAELRELRPECPDQRPVVGRGGSD